MCYILPVECFEPQGRHFTNFHYYYYELTAEGLAIAASNWWLTRSACITSSYKMRKDTKYCKRQWNDKRNHICMLGIIKTYSFMCCFSKLEQITKRRTKTQSQLNMHACMHTSTHALPPPPPHPPPNRIAWCSEISKMIWKLWVRLMIYCKGLA